MKKNIKEILIAIIQDSLKSLKLDKAVKLDSYLDISTNPSFGEYSSTIAFRLSSQLKKSPFEIASIIVENIKNKLAKTHFNDYIKEVKVEGSGFINFYFKNEYFYEYLKDIIIKGRSAFKINLGKGKEVLIEFVSANPTGPLSVAHARQAAVGDVLANMLAFLGFKVKREYYLNDEGNQINILGKSIELRLKQFKGEQVEFPEDHYQGDYICDIAKKIKNQKSKIKNFSAYGIKYILGIIEKELEDFGVKFDYWYSQKKLRESGKIKKALDFLRKKRVVYEKDGALWFKSTQFGDDKDRVVVKSDGSFTYLAPDIAYHQDKYKRGFSWLINLWGPDHHGYIKRLKAAVEALGKDPESLSIIIVQLASIFRAGQAIQMSTRRGQYITLREVLDEVGLDASRFFFLMRRTSSHLDFDLEVAKKQTPENPIFYVQYAHARICSILRNSSISFKAKKPDFTQLQEKEEIGLIKKLWQFLYILNICLNTQDPYMLTVYLQELSEEFHKFYDRHRVLSEDEELTKARLALVEATKTVIATGLDLLGVSKPEKM